MKVYVLYREKSDHARAVESFLRDMDKQYNIQPTKLDIDTIEGDQFAKLYDITSYPSVVVIQDDGRLQRMWSDEHLPMADRVAYETHI